MTFREAIQAAGMTHRQLARASGQSYRYVGMQLCGDRQLTPKLWRAALALAEARLAQFLAASGAERPEATVEETRAQVAAFVAQARHFRDKAGSVQAREKWTIEVQRLEALAAKLQEVVAW